MKILSLFDGMACGHIAFNELGIDVECYKAYEIDKFAIKVATHNFSDIEELGDVFKADFKQYNDYDWLIGGLLVLIGQLLNLLISVKLHRVE